MPMRRGVGVCYQHCTEADVWERTQTASMPPVAFVLVRGLGPKVHGDFLSESVCVCVCMSGLAGWGG